VRPPRKRTDESELYAAALRALSGRARSVYQMRAYLEERSAEPASARRVVERLQRENLLDDARYAQEFTRSRAANRQQGRFRIARELRARGVADIHIAAALQTVFAEEDESALLCKRIERKLKLVRGALDQKRRAALYASLLRAGFSADAIRQELGRWPRGGAPEGAAPEEP
jgi:regulatory protein